MLRTKLKQPLPQGRKPKWYLRMLILLEEEGELTWDALLHKLHCGKSALWRSLEMGKRDHLVVRRINAQDEIVFALSPSWTQQKLKTSIGDALKPLSLYPLETVATSYTSGLEGDCTDDASILQGISFILQKQYSLEMAKILGRYGGEETSRLIRGFAEATLNGLNYCLTHKVVGFKNRIRDLVMDHPDVTPRIIQKELALFLEYGLRDLVPSSFSRHRYAKSQFRLLAYELEKRIPKEYFSRRHIVGRTEKSIVLSCRNAELLRGFLDELGRIKFIFVVPFGFPEFESCPETVGDALQSFDRWMQQLREGALDLGHAPFLLNYGTANLKKFVNVLQDRSFKGSKSPASQRNLEVSHLPSRLSKKSKRRLSESVGMERNFRFVVDTREPWDIMFLYYNHPRGKDTSLYTEILSLVQKRRSETPLKGYLPVPRDDEAVSKRALTRKGFLTYHNGREQLEIVGPNDDKRESQLEE